MDTDYVRQVIIDSLLRFGADSTEPIWETLVISDGRHLGRQFEFHAIRVIWFWDRNTIEFCDKNAMFLGEIELQEPALVASYCPPGLAHTYNHSSESFH
jgi:hypothetical protein